MISFQYRRRKSLSRSRLSSIRQLGYDIDVASGSTQSPRIGRLAPPCPLRSDGREPAAAHTLYYYRVRVLFPEYIAPTAHKQVEMWLAVTRVKISLVTGSSK